LNGYVKVCKSEGRGRVLKEDKEGLKLYYPQSSYHAMLNVTCREVGFDCDYVAKGETEEELMKDAGEHAVKDHGYKKEDIMTPELQEKIRAHIRKA
jgi:predicted small metal-binding protein